MSLLTLRGYRRLHGRTVAGRRLTRGNVSELLGANTDLLDRHAQSLSTDAQRVQDIRTLVQRVVAELAGSWNGPDLAHLTQQWEHQTSLLLAGASASLDTCATRLRSQSAAQRQTSGAEAGSGPAASISVSPPAPPPDRGTPAGNAAWWRSLGTLQQERVIRTNPGWIGNRDGVSFVARDLANRALLAVDRGFLMTGKARLETAVAGDWPLGPNHGLIQDATQLHQVNDKLASIAAIEATLAQGDRQLLTLDLSQVRAQAAIANGNIETADNVAVFVPGMDSNVTDSIREYDKEMKHLKQRAEEESLRAHPTQASTTATVTWIGYQTPELGLDLLDPGRSVASDRTAKSGAANLVPFLRGVGAARDSDAHLTLLGHSYGSTTAGFALQQETGVDDAVFFGSPGLGTNDVQQLKLATAGGDRGQISYIEARRDPVGDLGVFGADPSHLAGIDHASAGASSVVDPVTGEVRHFSEVTGHVSYLVDNSTSQYNMSVVVAGLPERQVHDPGMGLGDVLTFPRSRLG